MQARTHKPKQTNQDTPSACKCSKQIRARQSPEIICRKECSGSTTHRGNRLACSF